MDYVIPLWSKIWVYPLASPLFFLLIKREGGGALSKYAALPLKKNLGTRIAMTKVIAGLQNVVLVVTSSRSGWKVLESLNGTFPQAISFDPNNEERVYCGAAETEDHRARGGVWFSQDGGETWVRTPSNPSENVMSLSVSRLEKGEDGSNVVYAGTEPSAIFRSEDEGRSWERMDALNSLKSSETWSFPPRPYTHHVRWIEPDRNTPGYVFAAIEAGALVRTRDGGKTWLDRVDSGPYDTHTLRTHQKSRGRLYSSAGDGYFESRNYGETWSRIVHALSHRYAYGLAVDSDDPETVVISSSFGPYEAHSPGGAESFVYRKSEESKGWEQVNSGLPEASGTMITIVCSGSEGGEFYGVNNRGIFYSSDSGLSWNALDIPWKKDYLAQHPWAVAISKN
jgi:photosystem II stability/assembly factor-like uncharacterized protein